MEKGRETFMGSTLGVGEGVLFLGMAWNGDQRGRVTCRTRRCSILGDAMEVEAVWGRHGEEAVGIYARGCHGSRSRMGA